MSSTLRVLTHCPTKALTWFLTFQNLKMLCIGLVWLRTHALQLSSQQSNVIHAFIKDGQVLRMLISDHMVRHCYLFEPWEAVSLDIVSSLNAILYYPPVTSNAYPCDPLVPPLFALESKP